MAKVAWIGLGVMGFPMAGHLVSKGGHDVCVYNRTAAKAETWAKTYGGRTAATPAEAASGAEFVISCVGNDEDLRQIARGPDGAFRTMKRGTTFIDHTTASADVARAVQRWRGDRHSLHRCAGFREARPSRRSRPSLAVSCAGGMRLTPFEAAAPIMSAYAAPCGARRGRAGSGQTRQDDQPDRHRRTTCRACRKPSPFAEHADLDLAAVMETISKGGAIAGRWTIAGEHARAPVRFRLRGGLDAQGSRHFA